ncbi:hypothetical protein DAPK24_018000 [Pichia kluyveri]|uniref:CRIB domain-containing protein n=1 Tax=Pichia kluyveri TaxID=36015 RepID=A0AAV5R1S0_PICKL|nr:hypothetical protein DAPK24_018000 [Pichia kluyveri]
MESLWLDDHGSNTSNISSNTLKALNKLQSEKFQRGLNKFIRAFDNNNSNATTNEIANKKKFGNLVISNPISFTHVSHVDPNFTFGVEKSFNSVDPNTLNNLLPITRQQKYEEEIQVFREIANKNSNNNNDDDDNDVDEINETQQTTLDPGLNKIQAFSSFRTSPTVNLPHSHSKSSSINYHHKRNSSCSTSLNISNESTFTKRTSYSDNSLISSTGSLKKYTLPCIPLNEVEVELEKDVIPDNEELIFSENDDEFVFKFKSIPSAPPPPIEILEPVERLKSIIQKFEDIEIASDSEDDETFTPLTKFDISSDLLNDNKSTNNHRCFNNRNSNNNNNNRNSIIQLFEDEKDSEYLMSLLEKSQVLLQDNFAIKRQSILNVILSEITEEPENDADDEIEDENEDNIINCVATTLDVVAEDRDEDEDQTCFIGKSPITSDFFSDIELSDVENENNIFADIDELF